ncbi:MAG: phosphonate C-P lyase system protein PhnG [Rubrimonas sp.]|uniref:phosphonate C-P lyase system protein PhnG n=1 Tax=Rubrimonas sp. TaxID=2036015 RepID=UPI002FDD2326
MSSDDIDTRPGWMGVLARSEPRGLAAAVEALWAELGGAPEATDLRAPQTGLAMARGRAGATGSAFNLGEVPATRCALRLADGTVGIAYALGRDRAHARRAALCDALMQTAQAATVRRIVLAPLAAAEADRAARRAARAAATRVEFFTLVRGEDG